MTIEDRKKIISEDFANAIVEYNRTDRGMDIFAGYPRNIINEKYEVVYFPISKISTKIVYENGYAVIPKLYGLLDTINLDAMGVNKVQNVPKLSLFGAGVLLGFVDTGIDYTNQIFKNADNSTRIVSIWDQTIENIEAPENIFNFGTEYSGQQINQALQSEDPFLIVPSRDEIGHGTMLAGIAGGSRDEKNDFQGVVPQSEIVVVKLKQAKQHLRDYFYIPESANCYQEDDIMLGIKYLTNIASLLNKPIAICIGMGTSQGAHDGYDILSSFIAWVGNFNGRGILIAAGNEGKTQSHYFGSIDPKIGFDNVDLVIGENDKGFAMELWGYAPNSYSIDILSPKGQYVPRIVARLGENRKINFIFENTTVYIDYLVIESQTGEPMILIRIQNAAPGLWKFRVYGNGKDDAALKFHIWLPIAGFISPGTYFLNSNPDTTITSPGNTPLAVTITAYNALTEGIYPNSSRGYTKNNYIKPEIAAPGENVLAPIPGNMFVRTSGTSIAAAHATGIAAMILEWGIVRGNYYSISTVQIGRFLIRGADTDANLIYPNNIWGYGTINIYNTFLSLGSRLPQ